jgi:Fe-S-cluster-containing dehydrogenase component
MDKVVFDLDIDLCCACHACSVACMDQNDTEEGQRPLRYAFEHEEKRPAKEVECWYFSVACFHCEDALCVSACLAGCLRKDPETRLTLYDSGNCVGCRSCAMICPYGVPLYNQDGKMAKCDGCVERIRRGMEPACVRVCPTGALKYYSGAEYEQADIKRSLRQVIAKRG